jgi:hypothetical protein
MIKIISKKKYNNLLKRYDNLLNEFIKLNYLLKEEKSISENRLFTLKMVRTMQPYALDELEEQIREEMVLNFEEQLN